MNQNIIDSIASRPGWRDYELEIIDGELYEVWLHHDWEGPKTCVPVVKIATDVLSPNWEVLVDGQTREVHAGQIFRIGTATKPKPTFTMPFVKRVYSGLTANEIVNVQPMTMPTTNLFSLEYKFGKEK